MTHCSMDAIHREILQRLQMIVSGAENVQAAAQVGFALSSEYLKQQPLGSSALKTLPQ